MMALAGLETGVIDDNFHVRCARRRQLLWPLLQVLEQTHGGVDLHAGIVQSCDVFFYNVGNKLGIDGIAQYAEMVGLRAEDRHRSAGEAEGLMPSSNGSSGTSARNGMRAKRFR